MKKIMMAFAVVAMAAGVQAATVDWRVTGNSSVSGYTAYLMAGDVVSTWASVAAIESAAIDSGVIARSGQSYRAADTVTDPALTTAGSFYYVVVTADETKYAVSSAYSGSDWVYDTTAQPPESAPAGNPSFAAGSASYTSFAAVPEPTSGLLLLLGVAGLALRRKQK